ncbi:hypothetical protein Pcinc_033723, partial [Petrolisthes cinctipes]
MLSFLSLRPGRLLKLRKHVTFTKDKRSSVDLSGHCGPGAPPHPGLTDLPDGRGSSIRGEEGYRGESPQPAPLYVIYDEPNNSVGVKRNSFR